MSPAHVLHVVHTLSVGGLENGLVNVINRSPVGLRHSVACLTTAGAFAARLGEAVPVFALNKAPGQDPRCFYKLIRLIRRLRPDVVHTRNWGAFDAILAARLAGVRRVVHGEHGRDIHDPEGRNRRRNRLRRLFSPLVTRFVAVSADLRRWLVDDVRIAAHKIDTIRNGVDTERFTPGRRLSARLALGLPERAFVVGTVGRLDPVKDQAGLIVAFAQLAQRSPDATLIIAGDGPCAAELRALVAARGLDARVHLLGERQDVPTLLAALDVFVLPSIAEGMSNTILEAMATGLPVVATRVGGSPELVTDGTNGHLVPARNPAAVAEAITEYLTDTERRAAHGDASRRIVLKGFGLDRMCADYTQLYTRLVSSDRSIPRNATRAAYL